MPPTRGALYGRMARALFAVEQPTGQFLVACALCCCCLILPAAETGSLEAQYKPPRGASRGRVPWREGVTFSLLHKCGLPPGGAPATRSGSSASAPRRDRHRPAAGGEPARRPPSGCWNAPPGGRAIRQCRPAAAGGPGGPRRRAGSRKPGTGSRSRRTSSGADEPWGASVCCVEAVRAPRRPGSARRRRLGSQSARGARYSRTLRAAGVEVRAFRWAAPHGSPCDHRKLL